MRPFYASTTMQWNAGVAIVLIAMAWFATAPALLTLSTFLALAGLLAGFGWITWTTCVNGQPAPSLAQSLHDAEQRDSRRRATETR